MDKENCSNHVSRFLTPRLVGLHFQPQRCHWWVETRPLLSYSLSLVDVALSENVATYSTTSLLVESNNNCTADPPSIKASDFDMKISRILYTIFFVLTFHSHEIQAARKPGDSVLLSSVKTLTVRKDLKTSHRRVSAVPQVRTHTLILKAKILIQRCS